ncbi:hypothetical protein [Butyrivibrio fibrisolvens]|uniref:hypothetical protein n=1 Tax=Butyrivibrio fibrisolvens TaxID=831 RepID=UPI0004176A0D|nr:hypothetical protein [Butyrivibrio fibrisolvens]
MKIVSMSCPHCGASLQLDADQKNLKCEYCGNNIFLDDEIKHIQFDNAEESGYLFEKGRQRAKAEIAREYQQSIPAYTYERPKKRRIWLWILGWLFIFPLPLTILMLRKKNMKPAIKYGIIVAAWFFYLIIGFSGQGKDKERSENVSSNESTSVVEDNNEQNLQDGDNDSSKIITDSSENHIYDNAEIIDIKNGAKTSTIGKISIIHADQSICTDEVLTDWYFNYVIANSDCNYHLIVYNNSTKGIFSLGKGSIQKDIALIEESGGTYALGDDAGSTYYIVDDESKSIKPYLTMADETVIAEVKEKIEAIIPDDYKNSKMYTVDIAGPEGEMDCNITIVSESFTDTDYQAIAVDLATQMKEQNLGIGYLVIAFQSDDTSIEALSSVDLSTQEATEIVTETY